MPDGTLVYKRRDVWFVRRHMKIVICALFSTLSCQALAQITADPTHGPIPNVVSTHNGLPQVDIVAPSPAGVSHNHYSQFDIGERGAILNNAPYGANTQLGGEILGNPALLGRSATLIINEVHANAPSHLRGFLEIAGQRADLIIANPNGIMVDGGGFINTSQAWLSTGVPRYSAGGLVDGLRVDDGTITVSGKGLDARQTDGVALLARATQINAAIHANELTIATGQNDIDYQGMRVTPKPRAGDDHGMPPCTASSPGARKGVAIDVANLGGMYANAITLTGTEDGMGMRVAEGGKLSAGRTLALNIEGHLEWDGPHRDGPGGHASAAPHLVADGEAETLTFKARSADIRAGLLAGKDIDIQADQVAYGGWAEAGNQLHIQAGEANVAGNLRATDAVVEAIDRITLTGVAHADAGVRFAANHVVQRGQLRAPNVTINSAKTVLHEGDTTANTFWVSGGDVDMAGNVTARNALTVNARGPLRLRGTSRARGPVTFEGSGVDCTVARTYSGDVLTIKARGEDIVHDDAVSIGRQLAMESPGTVFNRRGQIEARDDQASADNAHGPASAKHDASGGVSIKTKTLTNAAGDIRGRDVDIAVADYKGGDGMAFGSKQIRIVGGSTFSLDANGSIGGQGAVEIVADDIQNAGTLSGGSVLITAANQLGNSGKIRGVDVSLLTRSKLFNIGGEVVGNNVNILAADLLVADGSLDGRRSLTIEADKGVSLLKTGHIGGDGWVDIKARRLDNAGEINGSDVAIDVGESGVLSNQGGKIVTKEQPVAATPGANGWVGSETVSLNAGRVDNSAGGEIGGRNIDIAADIYDGGNGTIAATNDVVIKTVGTVSLDSGGVIDGNRHVEISGSGIVNGGKISGQHVALQAKNAITSERGGRIAGGQVDVHAKTVTVPGGAIEGTRQVMVNADHLVALEVDGFIGSHGAVDINAEEIRNAGEIFGQEVSLFGTKHIVNQGRLINAGPDPLKPEGSISIQTPLLHNPGGRITAKDIAIHVDEYQSGNGIVLGTHQVKILGKKRVSLDEHGYVKSAGHLAIDVPEILNRGEIRAASADLRATDMLSNEDGILGIHAAGSAMGEGASLDSNGRARIETSLLKNHRGQITAHDIEIDATKVQGDGGVIVASGDARITSLETVALASGGYIGADGQVAIDARDIWNAGEISASNLHLTAKNRLLNAGGLVKIEPILTHASWEKEGSCLQARELDNRGGKIQSRSPDSIRVVADALDNQDGEISHRTTHLAAHRLDPMLAFDIGTVRGVGKVAADFDVALHVKDPLRLSERDVVDAGGKLDIALDNGMSHAGTMQSRSDMTLASKQDIVQEASGAMESGGLLDIRTDAAIRNVGRMHGAKGLTARANASLENREKGSIDSDGDIGLTTNYLHNDATIRSSIGKLDVSANHVKNTGLMDAEAVSVTALDIENHAGLFGGNVTLKADWIKQSGNQARIVARDNVALWVRDHLYNADRARIYSGASVMIGGEAFANVEASRTATKTQLVENVDAEIVAMRDMGVAAQTLRNVNSRPGRIEERTETTTTRLRPLPWFHRTDPTESGTPWHNANTNQFDVYFVRPEDILSTHHVVTPDGIDLDRVVIRTHGNDSAFRLIEGGTSYHDKVQHRFEERLDVSAGTREVFIHRREDNVENPDHVLGAPVFGPNGRRPAENMHGAIQFDKAARGAATGWVRLDAESDYRDPILDLVTTQRKSRESRYPIEICRDAKTTVTRQVHVPDSQATPARIASGGAVHMAMGERLENLHGEITSAGDLQINGRLRSGDGTDPGGDAGGGATIENSGTRLTQRTTFDITSSYGRALGSFADKETQADREKQIKEQVHWKAPPRSAVIGHVGGVIRGGAMAAVGVGEVFSVAQPIAQPIEKSCRASDAHSSNFAPPSGHRFVAGNESTLVHDEAHRFSQKPENLGGNLDLSTIVGKTGRPLSDFTSTPHDLAGDVQPKSAGTTPNLVWQNVFADNTTAARSNGESDSAAETPTLTSPSAIPTGASPPNASGFAQDPHAKRPHNVEWEVDLTDLESGGGVSDWLGIAPRQGVHILHPALDARYLIETDARFTSRTALTASEYYRRKILKTVVASVEDDEGFSSSEYVLRALGEDPRLYKRLGDAQYELNLVVRQMLAVNGMVRRADDADAYAGYRALMDSGVAQAAALGLRVGQPLTEAQISALSEDIVWMVNKRVRLADGSEQTVLVPRVYLVRPESDDAGIAFTERMSPVHAVNIENWDGTLGAKNAYTFHKASLTEKLFHRESTNAHPVARLAN